MNKEVLDISKIKIESKINEILDKEIDIYKDNEFIKSSLEAVAHKPTLAGFVILYNSSYVNVVLPIL